MTKSDAELGLLVLELLVELRVLLEDVREEVGVILEIGQLIGHFVSGAVERSVLNEILAGEKCTFILSFLSSLFISVYLFLADVLVVATTLLNPFRKGLDILRETGWWVSSHSFEN